MADRARTVTSTARFGLTDDRAEAALRAAGWWGDGGPVKDAELMLVALSRSPDPDLALRGIDCMRESGPWAELTAALREDVRLRGKLIAVLGASTALADFLVANPDSWRALSTGARPDLTSAVADLKGPDAVKALRAAYREQLLLIAADDLGHLVEPELPAPPYDDVAARLTELAEEALRAALVVAQNEVGPNDARLAVIAMGKCGGRELNYVSDVDVVFLGDDIDVATRLASRMMTVAGSACFEVDAALRPEGKAGALVRTLEGHTAYYRRWARTWEFQALLKARPVAGDAELGEAYLDVVRPMVWTAADRDGFVADVQQMRRRVEDHVPAELLERELKLGRGGLRDVEFAVQLLQLVHGRSDESLRLGSTTAALASLGAGGYVGRADSAGLGESYRFLRTLEHRLQLQKLRRTHLFPDENNLVDLRWLARATGLRPDRGRAEEQVLLSEFRRHANRVRRLHEKLFYRPLLESVAKVPTEALRLTASEAAARLGALGYASPEGALNHISALTSGVSRRAAIQGALLPVLLDLLAHTPDPDGGLLSYRKMSEALATTPWYLRLLRDEGAVVERLAQLLGTSKLVPEMVARAPEVLRLLADTNELAERNPADVAHSLLTAVGRHRDLRGAVTAARSLRRHELARVACADLLGLMETPAVCEALSSVWVAVLQSALAAAEREKAVELGGWPKATIAIIGMGRLGGSELGYGSDADVMFVCEPTEGATDDEAVKFASAVVESMRRALGSPSQDPPLEVDVGLRPQGRQGPLVRTLNSYLAYYRQWSEVWEWQALLRAAFVAGDADLGARFIDAIEEFRYPRKGLDSTSVREIRRIKARVDNERLPRGADPTTHTKLGRGGLADIEWTVQLLQLRHAHEVPGLRTPSTLEGLAVAQDSGLITAPDAAELRAAWLLATSVRNAVMLVRGKSSDQVPTSGRELLAVATAVGYPNDADPGEFLDSYRRTTRRARAVVERVFYD
ncbi:bifunctional [glutamine synthetase] adenylyltransferase/[glutamine synthetase]-adenylyl-L-tyrosine phosphorylase [Kibdelosporangium philippinense]|uniref:Bifunctional glutamine synthetase adenylyltransferase/adenylyl-removing enzyme n=1 Tax=Kibdelosporangium philippinense TaxID=211113 RepID=A0ABS8ZLB7_9PSEU|nr:bifunctional [glutamine synthetase] adenylyltransferase/[glutamine synthetase]-adenylyl-L-tyrosine phosphorylase [Kibdelosporangium philippinense]MCE7008287.1 bifunctional [glutamine synthetase] adenylyltransferase/[glutamine synthetase]-adenylyl-L-tyrosine phosphorylase [Kibdelosporangium philippinense]